MGSTPVREVQRQLLGRPNTSQIDAMKRALKLSIIVSGLLALAACETSSSTVKNPERGPNGTIAYIVEVETNEPGARIEANGDYIGKTPCTLKIFGDKDGTFHNFGSYQYVIKAYPVRQGQYVQTKVFRTGGWFTPEDRIPTRLYFDLRLEPTTATQKIEVNVNTR